MSTISSRLNFETRSVSVASKPKIQQSNCPTAISKDLQPLQCSEVIRLIRFTQTFPEIYLPWSLQSKSLFRRPAQTARCLAQVMSNTEFLGFFFTWMILLGPATDPNRKSSIQLKRTEDMSFWPRSCNVWRCEDLWLVWLAWIQSSAVQGPFDASSPARPHGGCPHFPRKKYALPPFHFHLYFPILVITGNDGIH